MNKEIVLKCSPLRFYTLIDEDGCFHWIKKIESIVKYEGIGRELHLILKSSRIPIKDLLELIGLFRRYNFDIKQLKIFMTDENKIVFEGL